MERPPDPYRTLGLDGGASLADVKRAYRRLAKESHPDMTGGHGAARFVAIQTAYQAILTAVALGGGREASPSATAPARRATARRREARPGGSEHGRPRSDSDDWRAGRASPEQPGEGSASDVDGARKRRAARLGTTSYDDAVEFEPPWQGASWYGGGSGTYWTVNPREYADPRKHGPEYQARARARAAAGRAAAGRDAGAPGRDAGASGSEAGAPDRDPSADAGASGSDVSAAGRRDADTGGGPDPMPAGRNAPGDPEAGS